MLKKKCYGETLCLERGGIVVTAQLCWSSISKPKQKTNYSLAGPDLTNNMCCAALCIIYTGSWSSAMTDCTWPWSSAIWCIAVHGPWSNAIPHSGGLFFYRICLKTNMCGPALCRIALDNGTALCRIVRDHGPALCRIALDHGSALSGIARDKNYIVLDKLVKLGTYMSIVLYTVWLKGTIY
jgi:hypothetical protein